MILPLHLVLEMRFKATPDGKVWTSTTCAYDFWGRYLQIFDQVRVFARVENVAEPSPKDMRADGDGVTFAPLPYYIGSAQFLHKLPSLRREVRKSTQGFSACIYRVPSMLSELAGLPENNKPFGLEVVGDPYDVFGTDVVQHPMRPVLRWFFVRHLRRLCRKADAVAYVNEFLLKKRYPARKDAFVTNYSSVELPEEAYRAPVDTTFRKKRQIILFIGSLAQKYKGADVLVNAVGQCVRSGLDIELRIIGGGRYAEELRQQVSECGIVERTIFLGQLPAGDSVRKQIDESDLFVLPARTEGLPRAVIEAMARSKPCISTTVGGIPELLRAEDLVPPGDMVALTQAMKQVLTDPLRMEQMALRNYHEARHYHKDILMARRCALYSHLKESTESWFKKKGKL